VRRATSNTARPSNRPGDSQGCRGEFVTTTLRHLISTIEAGIDRVARCNIALEPLRGNEASSTTRSCKKNQQHNKNRTIRSGSR
jgi:hypothetical protein